MNFDTTKEAALSYVSMGLAVFPVGKDKKPLTYNGCKDASTDPSQVLRWWRVFPDANVAIATGSKSGNLIVLDFDYDEDKGKDGYAELRQWQHDNNVIIPDSWTVTTGRGGKHIYYRGEDIRNSTGMLPGVDVRGEGGYVVAPPSIHPNGTLYEWDIFPDDMELTEASEAVYKFLRAGSKGEASEEFEPFKLPDVIEDGKRNDTLFRMACSLWERGFAEDTIKGMLRSENELRCQVPLDQEELDRILESVTKNYTQGQRIVISSSYDEIANVPHVPQLDTNDKGMTLQTIQNAAEAIAYDPRLYGKIRYNILARGPYICGPVDWYQDPVFRAWDQFDDDNLTAYIESTYGIKSADKINKGLNIVLGDNQYNPVTDMLNEKATRWDGKTGHIRKLLPKYLGCDDTDYVYECIKVFMLGAICRVFNPGVKFDYVLILVGDQGVGKSTFFRYLARSDEWFSDNFNNIEGDKAIEKMRGMWICEMAELLATKKAKEVEAIKSFITTYADDYREPYAVRTIKRPRMCVFAGTTNNLHFLTDRTGNRRFLPVMVHAEARASTLFGDTDEINNDFDQAWGEAMSIYKNADCKPSLVLPKYVQDDAVSAQYEYMEEDSRVGIIQEYLDNSKDDYACVIMICREALGYRDDQTPTRHESNDIHSIMRSDIKGWHLYNNKHHKRKFAKYGFQVAYERDSKDGFMTGENSDLPF